MVAMQVPDREGLLKELSDLKKSTLEHGENWFVVDYHWYQKLTDYLQGNGDFPGPVDNSMLLETVGDETNQKVRLKRDLQDEADYTLVPERAWNLLREKFGVAQGQEPIPRKVVSSGLFLKMRIVEVYPLEVELTLYDESKSIIVPVSRAATLNDLKKKVREKFSLSSTQIRLYQKTDTTLELIPEDKANMILQEFGFARCQKIVVDVEEDGKWHVEEQLSTAAGTSGTAGRVTTSERHLPGRTSGVMMSDMGPGVYTRSATLAGAQGNVPPGLCGLTNLGNTCFMNSALQCLMNAGMLVDYFVSDTYKSEINESNPLGMHGEVAQAFGDLCHQVWSGKYTSVTPRNFKITVGRFAPQFSGYQQQDSQELMAFLLDGLHEDLNRVQQKPYVEVKDADGRPDEDVASEAWSNYRKRNDSIIVDLFHGLLKSTVICPECNKVSVTMDPFCYLSLPLPGKKERQLELTFVPLNPNASLSKMKVTVPKGGIVQDLIDAVTKVVELGPSSQLAVAEIYGGHIYKIYTHGMTLSGILDRDELYVYELQNFPSSVETATVGFYNRYPYPPMSSGSQIPHYTLTGVPMICVLPKKDLNYENLKATAQALFGRFMSLPGTNEIWWRTENGSDSGMEENGDGVSVDVDENDMQVDPQTQTQTETGPPFYVLKLMNSQGSTVFTEITPTNTDAIGSDHDVVYVSLDWHPLASRFFDKEISHYVKEHESLHEVKVLGKKAITLDDCLDLFTTTEKLGENDLWYCGRCKKHQQATKKFDVWQLPEILIVHLKRFSYSRLWRDKIEGLVDYPTKGLDLSKWVINPKHAPCVYDLVAVSNHYGGLGGGHYTAYAKNKGLGNWYSFDDSSVSPISERDTVTKAGYVLVYTRRKLPATIEADTDPNVEMEED